MLRCASLMWNHHTSLDAPEGPATVPRSVGAGRAALAPFWAVTQRSKLVLTGPRSMAIEIERKFLVTHEGWRIAVQRSAHMRQGYLTQETGRASVRVRLQDRCAHLNIKAAVVGSARAEYEYEIPLIEANEILDTLCVACLDKTRHYVEFGGMTWEIDEFEGRNAGLVVAEIELTHATQVFARPDWIGSEVTDERRYYNHALALHPYREW